VTADSTTDKNAQVLTAGLRNAGFLLEKMFSLFNYLCAGGQRSVF